MTTLTKAWIATIAVLSGMAIFGMLCADTTRLFAPANTVLYAHAGSTTKTYLPDGSVLDLALPHGLHHADPLPDATPWQNLRMYFADTYLISKLGTHPELFIGKRFGDRIVVPGNHVSITSTSVTSLPRSLMLWSTRGEPIETMKETAREPIAVAEGRYGSPASPSVILRADAPRPEEFLKLLTGLRSPSRRTLPLGDGSNAQEIIADTDSLATATLPSVFGPLLTVSGSGIVPALLGTDLLFSDAAVASEQEHFSLDHCPLTHLVSYSKQPLFALGTTSTGKFIFCAE